MPYNPSSSSLRPSRSQRSVAVTPYFEYNENLDMLLVATGPAFTERDETGRFTIFPAHLNRMKHAIRGATSQMSSSAWNGVRNGEAPSLRTLSDAMNETYAVTSDVDSSPIEREGTYKLSVYVTNERQPRQVPQGDHGLYEPTVVASEAEMSNLPKAEVYIRSRHDGKSHYFDKIEITMDGTVRNKATGRIVALRPSAIKEMASGFAHMVPFIQDRLERLTYLDNRERDTFMEALLKTRKVIRSLAKSTIDRLVRSHIGPDGVESVRPPASEVTDKSDFEISPGMKGLGEIPIRFIVNYSRMGG